MSQLKTGDIAPDFNLPSTTGDVVTLSQLRGSKVLLYFYPKDNTSGCTQESKDFAEAADNFTKNKTLVFGVSRDSIKSHQGFSNKLCLPFPLLSDIDGDVCQKYNVWVEKSMYGKKYMGIERSTFLIDENGIILKIWRKVTVANHVSEILQFLSK